MFEQKVYRIAHVLGPDHVEEVVGYADGNMGVHEEEYRGTYYWVVDHLPSGYRMPTNLKSRKAAEAVATLVGPLLPKRGTINACPSRARLRQANDVLRQWLRDTDWEDVDSMSYATTSGDAGKRVEP